MKSIYLDYAAATPMDQGVLEAMTPYLSQKFYNPSAMYLAAQSVRSEVEDARHTIAKIIGAKPAEVIFTSGATESNNLALKGIPSGGIVVSAVEHESVMAPAKKLKAKIAPVDKHGSIDLLKFEKLIDDQTILVSVILVSNELGTVEPLAKVTEIIKSVKAKRQKRGINQPLYLHTDAAQAANYFELNVARLGVDLMTINGSKLYGPKQTGVLYVRAGTKLDPQIIGGNQEFGLRSGTENVAGIIGLAKAYEIAHRLRKAETERLGQLRNQFIAQLSQALPQTAINGHPKKSAPHIVNVLIPGSDAERLMMELDERGIQAAVGSACSAADDEPSHVLSAIGLSEAESRSSLRFSFGRQTTMADLETTIEQLVSIIQD